jgi:hypothetical protein
LLRRVCHVQDRKEDKVDRKFAASLEMLGSAVVCSAENGTKIARGYRKSQYIAAAREDKMLMVCEFRTKLK